MPKVDLKAAMANAAISIARANEQTRTMRMVKSLSPEERTALKQQLLAKIAQGHQHTADCGCNEVPANS